MPSFLSKVFGRKKSDDKEYATPRSVKRTSDPSLLEGKFEAIPSNLSPSSPGFPEDVHGSDKGKDREGDKARPFGLRKSRSKQQTTSPTSDAPHLTLRLPGTTEKNDDPFVSSFNPQTNETDDSILTRRLTPEETLSLIEACSKAITERGGLETLGVMRPHWHSASPQLQRKLISLFILSLARKSPDTTLALPTSPLAAFNSELEYARSVHDIAAVFRWALRHLKLEGASFGSSSSPDEWSWYHKFYEAERKTNHDPRVFTSKLVPEIPSAHAALLLPTLDIISSLAAHAEANGYSGSKLTKYFGFWLLTARRATGTEDWSSFYTRWEDSGRMFEHLFLAWLRDENTKRPLPRRLQELVAQYPYTTSSDPTADGLLTRPRFSTRRHDALFVRVEAVYADNVRIPSSRSPVGIFTDALKSESKSDKGGYMYLWDQVREAAASDSDDKPLPIILSDDTINIFSLVSTDPKEQALLGVPGAGSTIVSPLSPISEAPLSPIANGNGTSTPIRKPTAASSTPQSPKDWAEFSSAGFGETTFSQDFASTLLDKDVEITEPSVQRKPSKPKQNRNITPVEPTPPASDSKPAPEEPEGPKLILAYTEIVPLDEAFTDFWRDAVVDSVSSDWPKFVVAELKHPLTPRSLPISSEGGEVSPSGPINWIIIEEKSRRSTPPPTPVVPQESLATSGGLRVPAAPLKRTSSPRPSFGEKKSSSLSATLKRFTLFGSSKDDLTSGDTSPTTGGSGRKESLSGRKKFGVGKSPKVGEMGEGVLSEEPEPQLEVTKKLDGSGKVQKAEAEVVAAATGVVGGAVLATALSSNKGKVEAAKDDSTKEGVKEDPASKDDPPAEEPAPATPVISKTEYGVLPPAEAAKELEQPVVETEPDTLPPAPESVISHGETPGPQLALDSTEAGLHHAPDVEEPREPVPEYFDAPLTEPVIEHLEDKVEDGAADAIVDLDPVPIVSNGAVEVEGVKEPEPTPEPAVEEPESIVPEVEEPTAEDIPATEVSSSETPAPVSEQEPEPEPSQIEPIAEEPQQVVTEDTPDVSAPEEPKLPSTQSALSESELVDDDVTEDAPAAESTLEVHAPEPVSHPTEAESHPPSEEPTEVQETV